MLQSISAPPPATPESSAPHAAAAAPSPERYPPPADPVAGTPSVAAPVRRRALHPPFGSSHPAQQPIRPPRPPRPTGLSRPLRQARPLPSVGTLAIGRVARVELYGAFVEFDRHLALAHVSQFPGHPPRATGVVEVGQEVSVRVISVDPMRRRITLAVRAVLPRRPAPGEQAPVAAAAPEAEAIAPAPPPTGDLLEIEPLPAPSTPGVASLERPAPSGVGDAMAGMARGADGPTPAAAVRPPRRGVAAGKERAARRASRAVRGAGDPNHPMAALLAAFGDAAFEPPAEEDEEREAWGPSRRPPAAPGAAEGARCAGQDDTASEQPEAGASSSSRLVAVSAPEPEAEQAPATLDALAARYGKQRPERPSAPEGRDASQRAKAEQKALLARLRGR